ncbi:MAG: hypothetical protein OXF23_04450 [Candidatus Dadabacteria bacterium]|nr:hypothetical protein [Candidatus Dadabacteria bacterium]
MRCRIYEMALVIIFALGLIFSSGVQSLAHTSIDAGDVDPTNETHMSNFLDSIITYYNDVVSSNITDTDALNREITIYGMDIRTNETYKDDDVYSIGINESNIITNHSKYPDLLGWEFKPDAMNSDVASTIKDLTDKSKYHKSTPPQLPVDQSTIGDNYCVSYGEVSKQACTAKVWSPSGPVSTIVGIDHNENDPAFTKPDCSEFKLDISAKDVFEDPTDENLVAYVEGIINEAQKLVEKITSAQIMESMRKGETPSDLQKPGSRAAMELEIAIRSEIFAKTYCLRSGDFNYKNIYGFIMEAAPTNPTVLINGNDPNLNGSNLDLNDTRLSGQQNIAKLFSEKLGDLKNGMSAYVNYHWDDPENEDDDVENFFRDKNVPGTSCKRSYIEVANLNELVQGAPESLYIFGSGTYPGDDACDEDGGCAIAGTGHTSQDALLNLFLMASLLFSVVFLRRRM